MKYRQMAVIGGVVALVGGGLSVAAMAAIPDGDGVYTGCVNTKTNVLRVIDTAKEACLAPDKEKKITWNQQGVQGVPGPEGPPGPQGVEGPAGVSGYQIVETAPIVIPVGASAGNTAVCPPGKMPLGGGFVTSSHEGVRVTRQEISVSGGYFLVSIKNEGPFEQDFVVQATCAKVS